MGILYLNIYSLGDILVGQKNREKSTSVNVAKDLNITTSW
jgi:hypothetical protein